VRYAPYILVLDADFACDRRILLRTLGLFDDSKVGIVQTPQFYYNADPIQHNLLCTRAWVDEQRLFFDTLEPAKDAWNAAFCVGTSFVVRRDLLDLIGGYPQDSIAEDLCLSYRLMPLGYTTRWLNEKLSVGLSAEGIAEYITQRNRWCLGAIQVALLKDGPVRGKGYTFAQRMHFFHGLLFWFSRPFVMLMLVAPVIYLLLDLPAMITEGASFLRHGVAALLATWAHSYWRSGRRMLPLLSDVSSIIAAAPVSLTIASALVRPFGRPFKVTDKGGDRTAVKVHWSLVGLFGGLIILMMLGLVSVLLDPFRPLASNTGLQFNMAWTLLAMVLCFISILVSIELPRPHAEERFPETETTVITSGSTELECVVDRLSVAAADLRMMGASDVMLERGSCVGLRLAGVGTVEAEIVDASGRFVEVCFNHNAITRIALVRRLFTKAPVNTAVQARPLQAWFGVLRRAFAAPETYNERRPVAELAMTPVRPETHG
jgi:cellulose synthase (UDP-forming)